MSFSRVLIANRGEIAVRVARSLQEMGLTACAVYSPHDAQALHAVSADEAYPVESYLDVDRLIEVAVSHGMEAVHPGYGFLSENAEFARRCRKAGLVFIGPSPEVIEAMGDKLRAKQTMVEAGVPVVPSSTSSAQEVGFPLLVKAAAGGGGKGMRLVRSPEELSEAVERARGEARKAFGDDTVFMERYIARPRHVEFQIFGDSHGNVVHLFERECSIQRRYQKIVEESPSPALTPELRSRMGEAAVAAARALGYTNAGTVEFIVDEQGEFYFLEVNTRLQVEHPVTEMVTRQDLVKAQVLVAMGEPLPFGELVQEGSAMECRIYAEDENFFPSTGTVGVYLPPEGPHIRVDSGIRQGSEVSIHYDPMLAKLVVWAPDRAAAARRMAWALRRFAVLGVTTNIEFLRRIVEHPAFLAGDTHTHFLEEHDLSAVAEEPPEIVRKLAGLAGASRGAVSSPWVEAGAWRMV